MLTRELGEYDPGPREPVNRRRTFSIDGETHTPLKKCGYSLTTSHARRARRWHRLEVSSLVWKKRWIVVRQ